MQGPQISTCIRGKAQEECDSLLGNDNLFCFEWWQVPHTNFLSDVSIG